MTVFPSDPALPADLIARPHLLEQLAPARLTLLTAPPGYGKTTLAAQFARQSACPVIWQTVTPRERDVPALHQQALAAIQSALPGFELPTFDHRHPPAQLAAALAEALFPAGDLLYILDDAHLLLGTPAAEAWLKTLVLRLPSSCHLLLLSRVLPNLPLTELVARRQVAALGQEALRFTPEEIHDLARNSSLPEETLAFLSGPLGGWPAGVILALQPLSAALQVQVYGQPAKPEALFHTLAAAMFDQQPEGLQDFLLTAATLEQLTPASCTQALGIPEVDWWLEQCRTRHLFLTPTAGGLAFHSLFREFLQARLWADDPARFARLHARAARWYEAQDALPAAFTHFLAAGQAQTAAALAERVAHAFFVDGKVETLLAWDEQLTAAQALSPRLLYTCSLILTDRYDFTTAAEHLDMAASLLAAREDSQGLLNVALQRALLHQRQGDPQTAADMARQLLPQLADLPGERGGCHNLLGLAALQLGQIEDAVTHFEAALPLARQDSDRYALAALLQNLQVAYNRLGRLEDSGRCLQEVVALRRELGSRGALALALNNLGYHYHLCEDYTLAETTFSDGLAAARQADDLRALCYLLWSMGDLLRDRGAFAEALQHYHQALEHVGRREPPLQCALFLSLTTLYRWQGQLTEAMSAAEAAQEIAVEAQMPLEAARAALLRQVLAAQQAGTALPEDDPAAVTLRDQGTATDRLLCDGWYASLAALQGDTPRLRARLKQALATPTNSLQPLVAECYHTSALRRFLNNQPQRYPALTDGLKRLAAAQMATAAPPVVTRSSLPGSLRVYTLGQQQVIRDGQPLVVAEWRAARALELFLYLLFHGPQTREHICLLFWPDLDPQRVRSNFHTTLYRARQALGEASIDFQEERYGLNPALAVWCDARELERVRRLAQALHPRNARAEDLWRQAVSLCGGEFLPDMDGEWVSIYRETMAEYQLEAHIGLGTCAQARGDFEAALNCYETALRLDPYREAVHRAIMTCHAERGALHQVRQHWQQLQALFQRDLALPPSPETHALARQLLP